MIRLDLPRTYPHRVEAKDLQFIPADANLFGGYLPRTFYNYRRDVGEGLDSNVVMSPVMFVMRTFTEATAIVESRTDGIWKGVEDHPLQLLIDKPNDHYDGDALWKATCVSYVLNGNAYWRKIRNRIGDVLELWYTPHWLIEPKYPPDGSRFISHYQYRPMGGQSIDLAPRDVVHFRFGLDPRDTRLGLSPLHALLREVFADDEAANFSAKMLENMGVAGMVITPKDVASGTMPDKDVDHIKTGFSGDNRGGTLVLRRPVDVHQYGLNPSQMTLDNVRDTAEERVCAALGIPAAIVGFGSGMQATKVGATMRELVKMAWVGCLTPTQHSMGRQTTAQLLPDFISQTRRFRVRFDTSEVEVFSEDAAALVGKVTQMVQAGVLRVDRAQDMLGLEVDDTQKIYLRPSNSMPIDENGDPIKPATPPGAVAGDPNAPPVPAAVANRLAQANGNGNVSQPD